MSTNDSLETTPRLPVHAEQKAARTGSTARFTPGPWHYDAHFGFVMDADNVVLAQTWTRSEENCPNFENNGPLIAAAPDLYKALSIFVEHFGDPGHGQLCGARAALAKAEGRS